MDDLKIKKEIIEKIKSSSNILITVSNDPSVDALSAALGLTLSLNKIEKYATAIYSGAAPSAISFLEPEKTFEENTDSLRDFIIALNKEKADHLRFKPEGDFVKIFITPYRSVITPEDLEFTQGDFNVELVIALGVDNKDHLDDALDNHGQILHDATVVSITTGEEKSSLGSINWHDEGASSLSELVVGLVESLKEDKKSSIIDASIATAFLAGIVAETERFSNSHTTSHVMTVASNLMSAGADQQLIASELQRPEEATEPGSITEGSVAVDSNKGDQETDSSKSSDDVYTLSIDRSEPLNAYGVETPISETPSTEPLTADNEPAPSIEPGLNPVTAQNNNEATPVPELTTQSILPSEPEASASNEQFVAPAESEPAPAVVQTQTSSAYIDNDQPNNGDTVASDGQSPSGDSYISSSEHKVIEPLSPIGQIEQPVAPLPEVNNEVPAPEATAGPVDLGLPMPPPLPDFSSMNSEESLSATLPTSAPVVPSGAYSQPEILGDILAEDQSQIAPQPALQPMPEVVPDANSAYAFNQEPAVDSPAPLEASAPLVPPTPVGQPAFNSAVGQEVPQAPVANNPGQFQIPSQPQ